MRINPIRVNSYSKISSFKSVPFLAQKVQENSNSEEYDYKKNNKIYRKTILKNKILTPIKLAFNKDYKELKKANGFEDIDFKEILMNLKNDRDLSIAIGDNYIAPNPLAGAHVDRIDGKMPYTIPLDGIEEYDHSQTDLADYARILNGYIKDDSISKEEKINNLKYLSTVDELVFKIERR